MYGFNEDKSKYNLGTGNLDTTNQTIIGAINELNAAKPSWGGRPFIYNTFL